LAILIHIFFQVSVFSKDLREAAEVGSGTNIVGNYELHDLVQLEYVCSFCGSSPMAANDLPSLQTVGVIFKTERDSFRVLDQNGQVRLVQPHQISMRRDSHRSVATDSEGHELRINDNMKETEGEVLYMHAIASSVLTSWHFRVAKVASFISIKPFGLSCTIATLSKTGVFL
jgi:transcription elongation factor